MGQEVTSRALLRADLGVRNPVGRCVSAQEGAVCCGTSRGTKRASERGGAWGVPAWGGARGTAGARAFTPAYFSVSPE